jgi:hypothetical protein
MLHVVSHMRSPGMSRTSALIERSYSKRLDSALQMEPEFETANFFDAYCQLQ